MNEWLAFFLQHWILSSAFLLILLIILADELRSRRHLQNISPMQATQLINRESAILLDLRDASAFQAGHIANAINMPKETLDKQLKKLAKHKNDPIIVVCQNANTSQTAMTQLNKNGFARTYCLSGGIQGWRQASLPLTQAKQKKVV